MTHQLMKFISLFVCIAVLFSLSVVSTYAARNTDVIYGDVNYDGYIEIDDVTLIQRHLASMIHFSNLQRETADFDHDGDITTLDATYIQRQLAHLDIPKAYGGWFNYYSTAKLVYADYASGKAMVGVPVTITMQGGYPEYGNEPSEFYMPITYSIEIYDISLSEDGINRRDLIETQSGYDNTFIYTFEKAGQYDICFSVCDRFDNETYYNCSYTVVEPYSTEKPAVVSVYTDKSRGYEALDISSFVPSCNWQEMTLYVNAVGGSGEYEYSFELITKNEIIRKDYSTDNSFSIDYQYFPGLDEYQSIREENSKHWNDSDYIYKRYSWRDVQPFELHITVKDSEGDVITETVEIQAIRDFDLV